MLFLWRERILEKLLSLQLIQDAVIDHLSSDLVNVDILQAGKTQDGGTIRGSTLGTGSRYCEDFTLAEEVPFETIREDLDRAFERSYGDSGVVFRYARSDRHPHANSHTFYLNYEGPLGNFHSGKEIKTDITIKEKMVFPIEERPILRAYPEYEDVPSRIPRGRLCLVGPNALLPDRRVGVTSQYSPHRVGPA